MEVTLAEVEEYAIVIARKRKIPLDILLLTESALPVSIFERETYVRALNRARRLIEKRDPDDVEILALALHLKAPLWSNDNDFQALGIEVYTTAELLRNLGISGDK
jgi:predicted nucleic acid-binding protein